MAKPLTPLYSTTDTTQPGYFRIGYVVLQIPPTDISTNRIVNDDQLATIRGISPMFIKSGQARWDVTVHWKAVRFEQSDGTYDYSQWVDLRNIWAIFKAAPFVEVENDFLRQHFTNTQLTTQTQRMAFALRQLRIDTNPDSNNVLDVVLTMSLFNYAPFSKDFGYQDANGDSSNSTDSTKFQFYIAKYISRNMDNHPGSHSSPPMPAWNTQEEGVTVFKWREYTWSPFNQASSSLPATSPATAAYTPTVPPPSVPKKVSSKTTKVSNDIQSILNAAATKNGLDPKIVTAQCIYESNGNPNAISRTGAVGLLQLLPSTAQLTRQQLLDPQTNAEKGCQYLAQQLKNFGNYPHALGAYNAGPAYIYAYRDGTTQSHGRINPRKIKTPDGLPPAGIPNGENTPLYVQTIMSNAGYSNQLPATPTKSTDGLPPASPLTTSILSIPDATYQKLVLQAAQSLPKSGDGWDLDYYTEQGVFFFFDHTITLASADSRVEGDFDLFPNQVSVVMVNNLPMIPLAAMQYPTYQHVGPADTMISISMNSVGDEPGTQSNPLNEPFHGGIQALAAMSSQLEDQFHNLRTMTRAVSSIHRMQAIFVQNQILNMLGIHGTMLRGLNTETVPEASDLVQVAITSSQYENIFEESSPYRINGLPSAYNAPLKNILTTGQINTMDSASQQAVPVAQQFGNAWQALDEAYLLNEIISITQSGKAIVNTATPGLDILTDMSDIATAGLRPDEQTYLLGTMDLEEQGNSSNAVENVQAAFNEVAGGLTLYQKDTYPGLQKRRLILNAPGKTMTFADYFVYSQLPEQSDAKVTATIKAEVDARFNSLRADTISAMYSHLFDWELATNPLFSRQLQVIANSKFFQDQFGSSTTLTTDGPNTDPANINHWAYPDLGLLSYNDTPAGYMVDYNLQINQDSADTITKLLGTANGTANDVNQVASVYSPGDPFKSQTGATKATPFSGYAQALPGKAGSLIRMTNIPGYSMNSAYPTYKLMLLEEDNTGVFFAFDNFYSYASVRDIEIIKYRDKPDTAIIQITNLAHLLQHRLYDDSAAGKLEKQADKYNNAPGGGLTSTGETVTGINPNSGFTGSKTAAGIDYQPIPSQNMTEGRDQSTKRVPLKYFALQTGAKIQVRMGFSNNPDALYPVFTGIVTEIEGDDILIITAQGFMLELMNVPGTAVKKDGYIGFNFLSGGAAFGGMQLMNSGTTSNILKTLLGAPTARHFGHWQIGGIKDQLLKGFTWSELSGNALVNVPNQYVQTIAHLLQSGYDRSGENILVNSIVNFDATSGTTATDGTDVNNTRRTFLNENPNAFIGTSSYSIPKQTTMNLWDIIKDVSRRYPWFNLMVRPYGFPYGADATLVYAHPLDWYYSRPLLFGEAEKEQANNISHGQLFSQWWSSVGSKKWNAIFTEGITQAGITANQITASSVLLGTGPASVLGDILRSQQSSQTQTAGSGPEGFQQATQSMHNILTGQSDPNAGYLTYIAASIAGYGNLSAGIFPATDAQFQALYREWEGFLQQNDPHSNSGRVKPVRRYHLIDHSHIVHNGIRVNDQMYNAVKIQNEKPLAFNQNIPEQHLRVLDVTSMINNVDANVLQGAGNPLLNAYAQSFLRDEVGKMYEGELVLRGVPEIEPYDIILLSDPSTGTVGPVEVDSVIHSFSLDEGYITIVKPRTMLVINEACSLGLIASIGLAWAGAQTNFMDLQHIFDVSSLSTNTTERIVGVAGAAGAALALGAGLSFTSSPVGIGMLALVAGLGIMVYAEKQSTKNMFQLMPLTRYGRPWIGGIQGFAISDFAYSLQQSFNWFNAEEISPVIESWNELLNYRADYISQAQT